jgi:hypothetical protein
MNEKQWLSCRDPMKAYPFVCRRVSERKLRLFAVACCRRIWHLLPDELLRQAVHMAERYADGEVGEEERQTAYLAVMAQAAQVHYPNFPSPIHVVCSALGDAPLSYLGASHGAASALQRAAFREATAASARHLPPGLLSGELAAQAALLRCIVGNPFRPSTVDPNWLSWNDGIVASLALSIYSEHRFTELPVLADALEEAGCDDANILDHCRQPDEHVRGCWVIDSLLGKE